MSRPVKPKIQYGKSFRYTSTEAAIKDLSRIEKKQREEKAKKRIQDEQADERQPPKS